MRTPSTHLDTSTPGVTIGRKCPTYLVILWPTQIREWPDVGTPIRHSLSQSFALLPPPWGPVVIAPLEGVLVGLATGGILALGRLASLLPGPLSLKMGTLLITTPPRILLPILIPPPATIALAQAR